MKGSEKGFSLLELVFVLSIIGIIIIMSIPKYNNFVQYNRLRMTCNNIVKVLCVTRQLSMYHGEKHSFKVLNSDAIIVFRNADNEVIKKMNIPEDINIVSNRITFSPIGTANNLTMVISNTERVVEIKISVSGRIRVVE